MPPARILVCRLRALGDVIRTFPAVAGLRDLFPASDIDFLCHAEAEPAVHLLRDVGRVHVLPKLEHSPAHSADTCRITLTPWKLTLEVVRRINYDLYVDMHGISNSGLFGCLANISQRIGFDSPWVKDGCDLCYTRRVALPSDASNRYDRPSHERLAPVMPTSRMARQLSRVRPTSLPSRPMELC